MKKPITDFGEKIGGAKKDLWRYRGLHLDDLTEFNDAERKKYVTKEHIWLKPAYKELLSEGYSKNALFFIKTIRDAVPTKPVLNRTESREELRKKQDIYVQFVGLVRDALMKVKSDEDIDETDLSLFIDNGYVTVSGSSHRISDSGKVGISMKLFMAIQMTAEEANAKCLEEKFLYGEDELFRRSIKVLDVTASSVVIEEDYAGRAMLKDTSSGKPKYYYGATPETKRKETYERMPFVLISNDRIKEAFPTRKAAETAADALISAYVEALKAARANGETKPRKRTLLPKQLEPIVRTGIDQRDGDVTGQDFLDVFKLRGGEFGNYLNNKDRWANMNFAYDSFRDLALALNIKDSDIGLNGKLAIAFGARGTGRALAHYEPMRTVINLTKMKGAGSLAHEFFHALDDIAGKEICERGFITQRPENMPAAAFLLSTMREKIDDSEGVTETDKQSKVSTTFYRHAAMLDGGFSKAGHGYWQSEIEMAARAFACYVQDKLQELDIRNDYLTGHAEQYILASYIDIRLLLKMTKKDELPDMNEEICIHPTGNERIAINAAFDGFFADLKKRGILHDRGAE